MPVAVCRSMSGDCQPAITLSAALKMLKTAGEVLDDVEDGDSPTSLSARYGMATAANSATTCIMLAETALTRLAQLGVEDSVVLRITDTVNSYYTRACVGQHVDLSISPKTRISKDRYKMISAKTLAPVECACVTGALLASGDETIIALFRKLGTDLGMACQLANDIQGIISGVDIENRKITLPVIYALTLTEGAARRQINAAFARKGRTTLSNAEIKDCLFRCGALQLARVKMEYYKVQATRTLGRLRGAGVDTQYLNPYVE